MGIFNKFKKSNEIIESDNTYMTILDSFSIKKVGVVVVCIIEEGEIKTNDTVQINEVVDTIAAIEYNKKILKSAEAGMMVGILLKNIQKSDAIAGEKISKLRLQDT